MNVYVRELCRGLSRLGVMTDVFTRRQDPNTPNVVEMADGSRIIHIDTGAPRHRDKYAVLDDLSEFACNVQRYRNFVGARYDLIHSHYWSPGGWRRCSRITGTSRSWRCSTRWRR